jgi:hypothetical protein
LHFYHSNGILIYIKDTQEDLAIMTLTYIQQVNQQFSSSVSSSTRG